MKILIVAMSGSVHTARWISQLRGFGWDVHLFPSQDYGVCHPDIDNISVHHSGYFKQKVSSTNKIAFFQFLHKALSFFRRNIWQVWFPEYRKFDLIRVINNINPDIIHSMETQSAGYLVNAAERRLKKKPVWIHTLWGSDIFLFGLFPEHQIKIRNMLQKVNCLICESSRDIQLARDMNYSGDIIKMQATGGLDLQFCDFHRRKIPVIDRDVILLKGYQTWAGRALVGIRALERCADVLTGYTILVYSADTTVEFALKLFSAKTGIQANIVPYVSHDKILELQAQARISLSLSISDGVPNSMLESMALGSFPIQSNTAATDDCIIDGINGLLVPPEDPEAVELAIRRALLDDEMVAHAFSYNWNIIKDNCDLNKEISNIHKLYIDALVPHKFDASLGMMENVSASFKQ